MFAMVYAHTARKFLTASAVCGLAFLAAAGVQAFSSTNATTHAAPEEQPAARIIVEPPKHGPLAHGVALLNFRTENLQMVPVFGPHAAAISPRIGHLHITVDDASWHWAHTSNDPVIVAVLAPGPHKVLFELADANHKVLATEVVKFEVPR